MLSSEQPEIVFSGAVPIRGDAGMEWTTTAAHGHGARSDGFPNFLGVIGSVQWAIVMDDGEICCSARGGSIAR